MRAKQTAATRLRLIREAERLFAERGVDGPTLLQIAQAADQKNRAAVQYHFGDRRGLIEAILDRHAALVQDGWVATLATMRRENQLTVERVVGLFIGSLVRRAHDPDGGAAYIQICRQLLVHPTIDLMETHMMRSEATEAFRATLLPLVNRPRGLELLWPLRFAHLVFHSIGDYLNYGAMTDLARDEFENELARSVIGFLQSSRSTE